MVIDKIESKEHNIESTKHNKIPDVDQVIFYNFLDSTFKTNNHIPKAKILEVSKTPELLELLYSEHSPRYYGPARQQPAFHLFNNNKHVQTFLIDNLKNSYHLFKHFHIVKKLDSLKLASILNQGKSIKKYLLDFKNVNDARSTLETAYSNNLPVIHLNTYSLPKWIQFDGEFVFSYSCLLKEENNDSIFELLKTKLDESKYDITYPQSLEAKDSVKLSYRVYSNQSLYNKLKEEFKDYKYISTFKKFEPSFRLFCTESEYEKIKISVNNMHNK